MNQALTTTQTPTRIEVWAQYELHFQERDALIAGRIGCSPAYWASVRANNLPFWAMMEQKALRTPPRLRPGKDWQQRRREDAQFEAGEFVRRSQRRESLMRRLAPNWLGWLMILIVAGLLFGQLCIPGFHDFLTAHAKGLVP